MRLVEFCYCFFEGWEGGDFDLGEYSSIDLFRASPRGKERGDLLGLELIW